MYASHLKLTYRLTFCIEVSLILQTPYEYLSLSLSLFLCVIQSLMIRMITTKSSASYLCSYMLRLDSSELEATKSAS